MPTKSAAFAAQTATSKLAPFAIDRRDPGPRDVAIEILFCGVCHSDLHTVRSEWPGTTGYMVPSHSPRAVCRSEWQTPQKRISISTSSGPGARRSKPKGASAPPAVRAA